MSADSEWDPSRYQFDFPDITYEGPLTEAPLPFKVCKVSVFLMAVLKDAVSCLRIGAELPALLAGLAAVDYVAGFYAGRRTTSKDYRAFMERFFPARYKPHLEQIYVGLRCGLMHNLGVLNPWNEMRLGFLVAADRADHLELVGDRLVFSVAAFLEDARRAWSRYAHLVVMTPDVEPEVTSRFNKRFNRLDGAGAFLVEVPD
jgi:hypothetical protein